MVDTNFAKLSQGVASSITTFIGPASILIDGGGGNGIVDLGSNVSYKSIPYLIIKYADIANNININNFLQNVKNTKGLINFGTRVTIDSANNKLIINIIYQPNYVADLIQINFINSGTNSFITIS